MAKIKDNMVATTFTLEGYKITSYLGFVRGIVVRSRSIVGNIGAGIQTIFGGNITIYRELCEKTRKDALEEMKKEAEALGADGIVGVRYDATDISPGVTEVLCYGTAVKIKKQ